MTRKVLGYARMGARNKIKGLANLSLADIKKIYRDEYKRVVAELRAWNQSKVESWKAWHESKSRPTKRGVEVWHTSAVKHFSGFEFFLLPSRVHARLDNL